MSFQRWRKSMQLLLLAAFPLAGADFKPVAERIQEQIMNRFADSHGIITDYRGLKGEIVLPTPEECERNIPNAKGYWTPIENGGFFTGLYLLGQCRRYRQEKSENTRTLIRRLVGGLCKLQDVATVPGFIARGVGTDGKYDVVDGIPLGPIKADDLKKYVNATKLPFVAKGVLSVSDAIKARAAGCYAIVVSHHHGRIPFGMPPVAVLPEIKKALAGSGVHIFVDCSIDTGIDAFKALCLGAEAVSVGRGILNPLLKEGKEGVVKKVTRMNEELSEMMLYTDIGDTRSFSPDVIYVRDGMKFEHC